MKSPPPGCDVHLDIALKALDVGLSPLLPKENGEKRPEGEWGPYQTTPATREEVIRWYRRPRTGNGLATGYGNLECLEFDDRPTYERFKGAAAVFGIGDVVDRVEAGYCESTPGGGIHWLYRCEKIDRNTKLAERPAPTEKDPEARKPLIETRGAGGFVVIAPSNGKVHPSGGAYKLVSGGLDSIITITPDEREALWSLARSFDEIPVQPEPPPRSATKPSSLKAQVTDGDGFPPQGVSPGDDFNARAKLADVMEPFGWERVHVSGEVEYWRRPGKKGGWSATWGKTKGFRVFTTSTSLEAKSHSLFYVYCKLRHRDDWKACVKDLAAQGYGTWIDEDGQEHQNPVPKDWKKKDKDKAGSSTDKPQKPAEAGYHEKGGCLYSGNKRLSNFTARIKRTILRHEAGSEHLRYGIEATHSRGHKRRVDVESEKYGPMVWVYGLGAEFAIDPGRDTKDLVRHAIQVLSDGDGIGQAVEHTSLGWIDRDGHRLYLHAGGAIGAAGPSDVVRVDIAPPLDKYRLPASTDRQALARAIEMHKHLWSLARPGRVGGRGAAAIVATLPIRAVLGPFDASVHFGGPSGNMKTSTARLAYQHFSDARGRHAQMPADWRSTANALQRLAFDCRDSLLIIDDLKLEEHVKTAEVIMQSQGNLQSRLRMNIDQSVRQPLDPRGSILSTGEIDPRTLSTRGRVLMVEIQAGDIDTTVLSRLQAAGDDALFSSLMGAYIRSLAGRLDQARQTHRQLTADARIKIGEIKGAHPRHPDIIAQLVAAYQLFMGFVVAEKLTIQPVADSLVQTAQSYLIEVAKDQVRFQEEAKAGRQFLDLLASALQSGRCHLLDADSDLAPNPHPQACGWRAEPIRGGNDVEWKIPSGSRCVGFISDLDGFLYLDPTESQAIATEMAKHQHNPQSFASVGRELLQEGLVESVTAGGEKRTTQPKRIHGVVKRCFWIKISHLLNPGSLNP
jgi:hypothetical protein